MNPPQKPSPSPSDKSKVRQQEIDAETAGQRLDNYLLGALKGVPRSHIYRLIRSGQVRVNSGRVTPKHRLQAGDVVRVPPVASKPVTPPSAAPDTLAWLEDRVIFEDSRLLVIDKPSGLAVHGGSSISLGCIEALRVLRPTAKDLELAHRLDRGTSGVLLIAKRRSALRVLHELLREGRIDKQYMALVRGRWPEATIEVDAPLVTRRVSGEARVKVDPEGKPAQSTFRVLERYGKTASLLEVAIATGRTHQIRVHANHVGHPVAGDDRYGDEDFNTYLKTFGLQRMFLHAHSVSFEWPETGEPFSASAPLPQDLRDALTALEVKNQSAPADRRRAP